jgi:hypothetical protein
MYAMIAVVLVVTGKRLSHLNVISCPTLLSAITTRVITSRDPGVIASTINTSTVVEALRETLKEQMDDTQLKHLLCHMGPLVTANLEVSKTPTKEVEHNSSWVDMNMH